MPDGEVGVGTLSTKPITEVLKGKMEYTNLSAPRKILTAYSQLASGKAPFCPSIAKRLCTANSLAAV